MRRLELAERVIELREHADLTQEEAAKKAGVGVTTWSNIETGTITRPHARTVIKIARALGVGPEELTAPKADAPPSPEPEKVSEEERRVAEEALLAWLEHLDLTLKRAGELRSEFRDLAEYLKTTPEEERSHEVVERRIAWVFSRLLEFSHAAFRVSKAYQKRLAQLLEREGLPPREGELLRAIRSRLEELHPIRRNFLDFIKEVHYMAKDTHHAEQMLRDLGQELDVPESDVVPNDV